MTLDEWITALHVRVMPPDGRSSPARSVLFLRPRLTDLPADWFTEDAIDALFLKLRSLNSADRVRKALGEFHAAREASTRPAAATYVPPPVIDWQARADAQRLEWDDPAGILRLVARHRSDHWALRKLAWLLARWAPQHLGLLPPDILDAFAANSPWQFASLLRRVETMEFVPPSRTRNEQREDLDDIAPPSRPRYLTPEQLDIVNPLPNGRLRVTGSSNSTPGGSPDATS